jgi:hypothetical protein
MEFARFATLAIVLVRVSIVKSIQEKYVRLGFISRGNYQSRDHRSRRSSDLCRRGQQKPRRCSGEFVRGDATTNTVEGFFSIFKRRMRGIYQHCGDRHLRRYLAEFDFRYSNRIALGVDDVMRTMRAIKGAEGKRLTYQQSR